MIRLQEIQSIYISQNRLVEGKDYVRAEWLKKSGLARIDIPTNFNMVDSVTTYFKHYGGTTGQMPVFGGNKTHALLWQLWENSSTDKSNRLDTYFNGQYYFFNNSAKEGKFKVKFNWQTKKRLISWNDVYKGGWLDCALDKTNTKISVLDAGIFNANWITHTGALAMKYFFLTPNIYLYPCQLLRSIPASLDANGIARTAGECGMVDSISGKFYGNVASRGAFTVENLDESGTVEDTRLHQIYRNKLVEGKDYIVGEMLKSAGSWLDTKLIDFSTAEYMELKVGKEKAGTYAAVFGCVAPSNTTSLYLNMDYYSNTNKDRFVFYYLTSVKDVNGVSGIVRVDWNTNTATINTTTVNAEFPKIMNKTFPLFARKAANGTVTIANEAANLCISYFKVDGLIDLKPCKLLRSIPRNLDAQCKSRQTGECGMIDLISGRFYGNVADSGVFSLEWDEWLKDCSIQFNPEATLEYSTSIPNDYVIYGRIEVAKLTAQYTDFGFMQASNNYIILGESTVYVISDWGTNKWATFVVSYSGGYECSLQLNGVTLTTITSSTPYNEAPHIQLHGIMQLNKIEHTFYPNESDPTQSHSEVWKRFVDQDGRQGLGISDLTYKIYAD